jgi:hypothetical protein
VRRRTSGPVSPAAWNNSMSHSVRSRTRSTSVLFRRMAVQEQAAFTRIFNNRAQIIVRAGQANRGATASRKVACGATGPRAHRSRPAILDIHAKRLAPAGLSHQAMRDHPMSPVSATASKIGPFVAWFPMIETPFYRRESFQRRPAGGHLMGRRSSPLRAPDAPSTKAATA